jgi:hypothetical protein
LSERNPITSFNLDFKLPIDVSKTFGFEITAYPPAKPKYESLNRLFNRDNLTFYEVGQGSYHLERTTSLVEATVNVTPNLWEEQTQKSEITIICNNILYRNNFLRKEIVDLAEDISSRMSWKHKIVWHTYDGDITEWKNTDKEK